MKNILNWLGSPVKFETRLGFFVWFSSVIILGNLLNSVIGYIFK